MAKFLSNINLEAANDIQFKTTAGANAGKISQTGDDLVISNDVGDILLGNGSDDVFIGDGTNTVDIRFEQDMAIFADSSSTRTLTLGGTNTNLVLESPSISGTMTLGATTINNKLTFTTANGYILFDYEPAGDVDEYTTEVPLLKVDHNGAEKTILSRISQLGAVQLGHDDMVLITAGDVGDTLKTELNTIAETVVFAAESGFHAYGFPGNNTAWANRNEFRFRSDSTTASENGLYIGDGTNTQFIDLSRNLKNIGTIHSGVITAVELTTSSQGDISTGTSYQQGSVSDPQPKIKSSLLAHSPEDNTAVIHPYLFNDLANFVARGGTVTYSGLSANPTSDETARMFEPSARTANASQAEITGSTWSIELTDFPRSFNYGTRFGISFGASSFAPSSMLIEYSTDNGSSYTTALNSSAASTFYHTYIANGGTAINAVKFTLGKRSGNNGPRVMNIYAYNYDSRGMTEYFVDKGGDTLYGNLSVGSNSLTAGSLDINGNADISGTTTTSGNITATASNATISAAESGGATTKIMGASVGRVGTSSNHNLEVLSNNTAAITIDTSQNATFAGNVTAGSNSLTAGSLDINGNADISGNITGATWNGGVISSAYLDSDTAHLSGSQTFTGAKVMEGNLTLDDGNGDTPTLRFINGDDDVYQFFNDSSSDMKLTRTNNGGVDYNFNAHETDYTQSVLQIGGTSTFGTDVTIAGNLTVNGTTVTVDTTNLNVQDKNITLNYSTSDSSSSANGAGITIQDAVNGSTDATILWDTSAVQFKISHPINVNGNILTSGTVDGRDLQTDGTKLDTIDTNANAYVHPTNAGNKHIPAAGATGQVLQYAGSAGTAQWHTLTSSDVGLGNVANVDQRNASNINNGTIGASFLPTTISSNTSGSAASLSGLSLGDIVYGGESGYAKLSGNAESNNKFLRSRGAANTATEPEWTQVGYSDLTGTVPTWNQNTTGSAATLSSTLAVNRGGTGAASLDAAGIVEKTGSQTIAGTKTFTGSLLLDDGTGASPTMRFMNENNDEVSIFCNPSGKMKFQTKADGASNVVQMTMDGNGLDVVNGLKINGSAVHATDTSTSLGTSNTLVPSQNAVKSYVDNEVAGAGGGTMSNFLLAATGTSNTATIAQGDTVTFGAGTGITATRSGKQINITNSAPNVVQTTITGNAGTATKLQTARNIAGVSFDGSGDISLNNNNITNGAGYTTNTGTTTASNTQTFTNKTIDANGTGNSITNIDIGNMTAAVIVTESEGIGNNDNDTTIPTSAAVVDYVDNNAGGGQTYSVSVPTNTTKLRLTASGGTTDDIEFTGGTDISVTRTNGSALSIAYTGSSSGYTLPAASNSALGGIKTGFSTNASNRNYAVQLSSQKAYVNVPWTDNNTMGLGFVVEDGDGTAVTITEGKYLKFKEGSGNGININFTDISTGSSTDEFDLDFNLNIAGLANDLTTSLFNHDSYIAITDSEDSNTTHKMLVGDMVDALAGSGLLSNGGTGNNVVAINVGAGNGISVTQDGVAVTAHSNITVSSNGVAVSDDIFNTNLRIGRGGTGMYMDYTTQSDAITIRTDHATVGNNSHGNRKFEFTNGGIFRSLGTQVLNYTGWSDKRLKKNIKNLNYGLDAIMKLRPVSYAWKKEVDADKANSLGFIAQEVEKVIPELVTESETIFDDKKAKGIDYVKMVAVLTKAVQEQQKQIDELKKLINGNSS